MQLGLHYHRKIKNSKKLDRRQKKLNRLIDGTIYLFATIGALIFIPQLMDVWTKPNISGVSLISWAGMFIGSVFWLFYGFVHKARPIMYASALGAGIQLLIIVGILLH